MRVCRADAARPPGTNFGPQWIRKWDKFTPGARSGKAEVVRITAVTGEWIEYRFLHGPERSMRIGAGAV